MLWLQLLRQVQLPDPPGLQRALPPRAIAQGVQAGGLSGRFMKFAAKLLRGMPASTIPIKIGTWLRSPAHRLPWVQLVGSSWCRNRGAAAYKPHE